MFIDHVNVIRRGLDEPRAVYTPFSFEALWNDAQNIREKLFSFGSTVWFGFVPSKAFKTALRLL